MVSFYFDKKRDIVNGIRSISQCYVWICVLLVLGLVMAGGNIGGFIFGPLSEYLMYRFGWKIGFIVLAFILLTCILFGAIMKPLKPERVPILRTDVQSL